MRHYKMIENGYIPAIGTGPGGVEITEEEYNEILAVIRAKPEAEAGYDYRLKEDMTWELTEVPEADPEEQEATEADYLAALAELGVSV